MGNLSRKRKQPRIVKKNKPKSAKNLAISRIDPTVRNKWNEKLTLRQNFANLGLALDL